MSATDATAILADLVESTTPFIEASAGLRERLIRAGYSETVAERIAAEWLVEAHRALWRRSTTTP